MKYIIETSYPANSFFAKKVFSPGWYGGEPYFDCGTPYTDGIGTQHLDLRVSQTADDPSIQGHIIGKTHVPRGWVMVKREDHEKAYVQNGRVELIKQILNEEVNDLFEDSVKLNKIRHTLGLDK